MMPDPISTTLTIAGSDPIGGAGLEADLKTFSAMDIYGMSVVTVLTAGNSTGVKDFMQIDPAFVGKQIEAVVNDIPPKAVKTGMMGNIAMIEHVARELDAFDVPIIVDPVLVTKHGDAIFSDGYANAYVKQLIPRATLITPNVREAELLIGTEIEASDDLQQAAQTLKQMGCENVVVKGGRFHDWEQSDDLFYDGTDTTWLKSERIDTRHTHGSGDVFSAAITAELAKGVSLIQAMHHAKNITTQAITNAPGLGKGNGPVGVRSMEYNQ